MSTEKIMEQAQVFASAWSLVGGRFDNGGMVEIATEEKAELKTAIEALVQQRDEYQRAADAMAMSHKVERDALRKEIEQLTETSLWQAGRISELLDEVAAQRKVLEMARRSLMASTFYADDGHPLCERDVERHEIITAIQEQLA